MEQCCRQLRLHWQLRLQERGSRLPLRSWRVGCLHLQLHSTCRLPPLGSWQSAYSSACDAAGGCSCSAPCLEPPGRHLRCRRRTLRPQNRPRQIDRERLLNSVLTWLLLIPLTLYFQKASPKVSETRPHISRLGDAWREPRSEQESLPTISNLGSWNGLLAHLLAGFVSATASRVRAEKLRRIHFDLKFNGRPALSLRACTALSQTVLCQLRPGALSNPSIFQRCPCSHYGGPRVVQPLGASPSSGSCARHPEHHKYIAQTTSVQGLRTPQTRVAIYSAVADIRPKKPLGHLPSPEDGPQTPTGQSLASEMLPSELSCGSRLANRGL